MAITEKIFFVIIMNEQKEDSSDYSAEEKFTILLELSKIDALKGDISKVEEKNKIYQRYNCSRASTFRWKQSYEDQIKEGILFPSLGPKRVDKCGRKSSLTALWKNRIFKANSETLGRLTLDQLRLHIKKRFKSTLPKETLRRWTKKLGMKTRRSYVKPLLRMKHRAQRLRFILEKLDKKGHFKKENMTIHVDEKWFYLTRVKGKVRITPNEPRFNDKTTQHKSHIEKVMFLSAIGKPQFLPDGTYFDGKIGIWPFITEEEYKRNTKHHKKGDKKRKAVSCTAKEYLEMMTKENGVLDAVCEKLDFPEIKRVKIQHDGASPHVGKDNPGLLNDAGRKKKIRIKFEQQPAQSPDLNKNDLCFFHSLQRASDALRFMYNSTTELMEAVETAYWQYPVDTLERIHALQYEIYRCILKNNGGNQYKLPHSGIRKRQKEGRPVEDRKVDKELVKTAQEELVRLETELARIKKEKEEEKKKNQRKSKKRKNSLN